MDCCSVDAAEALCPSCGVPGRRVGTVTLTALVPGRVFETDDWKFCRTSHCPVAYYKSQVEVAVNEVIVPITQKTTAADRPVCYCFGYSADDIEQDSIGVIPVDIRDRCRRGEDRCPLTNPQGSCCLGNVLALVKP